MCLKNFLDSGGEKMPKDKIGFIGLGIMGKGMARGLIERGIDTMVHDLLEEPVKDLEKLGAKVGRSPKEIGALCDIVILMVRDTAQADAIIVGEEGVLSSAREGSVIVIMSTVDPLFCQRTAEIAQKKGVGLLDAPVSGGQKGAETHTLTIVVGGDKYLLERCRYVFEAMGSRIFHVGAIGTAQVVKIAANSISHATAAATAGAIALASRAGIELERFLEIVPVTSANSWVAQNWELWSRKGRGDKKSLDTTNKDLKLALGLAKAWGISLPLSEAIAQLGIDKIIENAEKMAKEVPSMK
jgi:3-hydroxyisobutyrate dehydrogenase-like beta-hydroxyacid dehydrogenase